MIRYAVRLVQASRPNNAMSISEVEQYVGWGAGPRASQTLILGAKARAALQGRMTVSGEDIRALAPAVLQHRIVMNFKAEAERIRPREVVAALLEQIGEHEA